jgi:HEAT repeat protein
MENKTPGTDVPGSPGFISMRYRYFASFVVALAAGCRVVDVSPNLVAPPTATTTLELDSALADELHELLGQSAWQVDVKWSVITIGEREPSRVWRYVFRPKPADENGAVPMLKKDSYWRGLWDGTIDGFDGREREAIEALLKQCRGQGDPVYLNSVILLARWDARLARVPADGAMQTLLGVAEGGFSTPDLPVPLITRCAAAEAWCRGLLQAFDDGDSEALDPAGRLLERPGLPDELRATLWRNLAVRIPPDSLPGLSRTVADRKQQTLRRAAVEACVISARWTHLPRDDAWPESLPAVRLDADPMLRQLFARWAALSHQDGAVAWLAALSRDVDLAVQDQAIFCLGRVHTDAARETLREICRQDSERRRAQAVAALVNWGVDEIRPFASDASPTVRAATVTAMAKFPGGASQRLLRDALGDGSLEVQAAAVTAVTDWPAEQAVPVLLEAIRSGALRTRQQSQEALQTAVGPNATFPIDAPLAEREQVLRSWAALNGWQTDLASHPSAVSKNIDADAHAARMTALLDAYLATPTTDAWDQLQTAVQPSEVPLIERACQSRTDANAERLAHELLPVLSPVHAAVEQLANRDVQRRRQAARQLAESAADHALSPFVMQRLHGQLSLEQDQLVWQLCMAAVDRESHAEAAQIALLALHNTWPDVRRLGVEYTSRHPTAEAARWLLPLFRDPQRSVRLAALSAAGLCGNPIVLDGLPASGDVPAQPGLRPLLPDSDVEVRWTVLLAMARLRDDAACQELVRLTFDPHPVTREQAVRWMGQSGQRRFVEPLLKLLWTEPSNHVKQTILTSLDELVPPENRPHVTAGLAAAPSIDDKVHCWAAWWTAARAGRESSYADGTHDEAIRQTHRR